MSTARACKSRHDHDHKERQERADSASSATFRIRSAHFGKIGIPFCRVRAATQPIGGQLVAQRVVVLDVDGKDEQSDLAECLPERKIKDSLCPK